MIRFRFLILAFEAPTKAGSYVQVSITPLRRSSDLSGFARPLRRLPKTIHLSSRIETLKPEAGVRPVFLAMSSAVREG
jgi:hypothetical protein